jgi:ABC-type sugar transport system substrate-binding protein
MIRSTTRAATAALAIFSGLPALAQEGPTIHLLNPFVQDEFWQGCSAGARRAAEATGATITELDANNLAQTQANQIDVAIQQAPDAILISPLDSNAVVPQLTRAMEAGTEVYAFNTAAPNAKLTATVAMDEVATGAAAAAEMARLLQARAAETGRTEFRLLHLVGAPATEAVRLRRDGFNQAIAQPVEGITIAMEEVVTDWKPELAVNGLQDALTKGPLDAIFTESDFLTPFLVPVLQREGYTPAGGEKPIVIGGLGGIPGGLTGIRDRWQSFTLNYPIDGMCAAAVYLVAASHAGQDFAAAWETASKEAGLEGNAPTLVESETAGPSILLTANLIDASNVESDAFWANTFRN